jgi:hypothetical protein
VAEDDALRAVRAAVDVQRSFREFLGEHPELTGRVGLRVAVNTGEVVVSDDYAAGIGDPLNVAARLQQEAKDGDVLLGESTQRLVAERVTLERVGSFALKGRAEPVTAYRVVSLERPAGAAATPFVGREDELRRITAVYEAALRPRPAVLHGSPGAASRGSWTGRAPLGRRARAPAQSPPVAPRSPDRRGAPRVPRVAEARRDVLRAAIEAALPDDEGAADRDGIAR